MFQVRFSAAQRRIGRAQRWRLHAKYRAHDLTHTSPLISETTTTTTMKTKEDSHYLTPLSMPSHSKLQSNAPEVSIGPVRLVPTAKSINSRVQSV